MHVYVVYTFHLLLLFCVAWNTPEEAIDSETTQPLIVRFTDTDKDIVPQQWKETC